jgi:UDP-glucose 4-epimerase
MDLVTGAAGYIGSHFVKRLLDTRPDETVVAVDNLSEGHVEALGFSDRIRFEKADIGDTAAMAAIFRTYGVDRVIHFAASCYVEESRQNPVKYFHNNGVNALRLFEAMQVAGVQRIVFSSTCATYGIPDYTPIDEEHPQRPINVYGATKLMAEQALRAYVLTQGWSCVTLRYFNAAGADESGLLGERHEPETHLIPGALQTALGKRKAVRVLGTDYDTPDGTCIRDYIHVNDLADAHLAAMDYLRNHLGPRENLGEGAFAAFNLGTSTGASVADVIRVCREVTGREISMETAPRRSGDPAVLVANAEKAARLLGWKPAYDLRRIIETAWQWEQNPHFAAEQASMSNSPVF